jgi:hypothetical protein
MVCLGNVNTLHKGDDDDDDNNNNNNNIYTLSYERDPASSWARAV